jgi:hypothetical protein
VTGLQHLCQVMDKGHTTTGYIFGFLMIEDNTGASPEEVKQALEALDKFSTLSIADPAMRNWIRLVQEDVVFMVRRYEIKLISLYWGMSSSMLRCWISRVARIWGAK